MTDHPQALAPIDIDPYDPALQQCPVATYHRLRGSAPVYYSASARAYLVTSYALVSEVLRDSVAFSNNCPREDPPGRGVESEIAQIRETGWPHVSTLATQDAPLHGQYRSLVAPFFSPGAVRAYEARAREVSDALLDGVGERAVDFVAEVAEPLPVLVTTELMGLDPDRTSTYRAWTKDATVSVGNRVDDERRIEAERGLVEMQQHFAARIEHARREPGDDYFTALTRATLTVDHVERPLDLAEMISLSRQLFVGGIETTTKLIAEAVRTLAESPDTYSSLAADPSLIPSFVEETLRLSSPAQGIFRRATRDVELGGVSVPAGATVIIMFAAANRDPEVFDDPDVHVGERHHLRRHLAFGKGAHFCLGAPISRMEAVVVLEGLIARYPRLSLVPGRNDFAYEPSFILRGLTSLWVRLQSDDHSTLQEP